MKLSECRLDNIAAFLNQPISISVPSGPRPDWIAITVAHRLAYLIWRLETEARHETAVGAKWYLEHLDRAPLAEYRTAIQPFVDRLRADLDRFEGAYGVADPTQFDRMVEFAGVARERVLYGREISFITGPAFGSPARELATRISYSMWRQSVWD
jgi:hypothetical protein